MIIFKVEENEVQMLTINVITPFVIRHFYQNYDPKKFVSSFVKTMKPVL
jgi:hypothetical protein